MKNKKRVLIIGSSILVLGFGIIFNNINNNPHVQMNNVNTSETDKTGETDYTSETAYNVLDNSKIKKFSSDLERSLSIDAFNSIDEIIEPSESLNETDVIIDEEPKEISNDIITAIDTLVKQYYVSTSKLEQDILQAKEGEELKDIANGILNKRNGIKSYKDINTYIRRGLDKDTYVVFTSYNMEFENIKTLAPGMSVLYIITAEDDGKLKILDIGEDAKINSHISELAEDDEIIDVINKVNSELTNALEKDEKLNILVDKIS